MRTLIAMLLMFIPVSALPCTGPEHSQFDFWVGSWHVELPNGKPAGTNRIAKINNGCALLEEWTGAIGTNGKSLNMYDSERKVWHQTWVDTDGTLLVIEGKFENGSMRMGNASNRITWTPSKDGNVRQLWEQSTDSGKTWKVAFDGKYIPAKENP